MYYYCATPILIFDMKYFGLSHFTSCYLLLDFVSCVGNILYMLNTTNMKMDLNTKLNHNQNICKDQYIRVNLYTPTTAVHMGQFNYIVYSE
jgi:hypothetical protein